MSRPLPPTSTLRVDCTWSREKVLTDMTTAGEPPFAASASGTPTTQPQVTPSVSARSSAARLLQPGGVYGLIGSPHFPMHTPPQSRSASPSSSKHRRTQDFDPLGEDESDKLQYEWQFEILNHMPREKAIHLVDHLRRTERERAQANLLAEQLQRSNKELQKQLDASAQNLLQLQAAAVSSQRGICCCCLRLLLMALLLLGAAGAAVLATAHGLLPLPPEVAQLLNQTSVKQQLNGARCPASYELTSITEALDASRKQTQELQRQLDSCSQALLEKPDISATCVEPSVLQKCMEENHEMKIVWERLQDDISDAMHKGRDKVCWTV